MAALPAHLQKAARQAIRGEQQAALSALRARVLARRQEARNGLGMGFRRTAQELTGKDLAPTRTRVRVRGRLRVKSPK